MGKRAEKRKPWQHQADRNRKLVSVTLGDRTRAALEHLAERSGETKSAIVERLILDAAGKPERREPTAVVANSAGAILPNQQAWGRIERAFADVTDRAERYRLAQIATVVELMSNSLDAGRRRKA